MGYAEVIEEQGRTLQLLRSPEGRVYLRELLDEVFAPADIDAHGRLEMGRFLVRSLERATAYAVSPDIGMLCYSAGLALPEPLLLHAHLLPTSDGWLLLDSPLPIAPGDPNLCWGWLWGSVNQPVEGRGTIPVLVVAPISRSLDSRVAAPGYVHLHEIGGALTFHDDATAARAFFALLLFMHQRILAISVRPITNRNARKRLARQMDHEPVVRVVELRARDYQQRDESQSRDVEYTCQWLVRGHWHQYHTREGLQPRWVMPYVKGPSDKPLRVAEKVAYEVVR